MGAGGSCWPPSLFNSSGDRTGFWLKVFCLLCFLVGAGGGSETDSESEESELSESVMRTFLPLIALLSFEIWTSIAFAFFFSLFANEAFFEFHWPAFGPRPRVLQNNYYRASSCSTKSCFKRRNKLQPTTD